MLSELKKKLGEKGEAYLRVKINPGARQNKIREAMQDEKGETIKIDIAAQPEKGKANRELVRFLAKESGLGKDNIKIISGAGDRIKLLKFSK